MENENFMEKLNSSIDLVRKVINSNVELWMSIIKLTDDVENLSK